LSVDDDCSGATEFSWDISLFSGLLLVHLWQSFGFSLFGIEVLFDDDADGAEMQGFEENEDVYVEDL
jgi:hypothetical protein